MRRKILIHSIAFSPDGVSTAYLYNDIALGLKENGYEIVVLTTTPHYNRVEDELLKQPLKKKLGGLYYRSDFNGIDVYHVPQKKFKSTVARIFGFIYWHVLSFFLGLFQKNIAVILSPSPPLTIGLVSLILAKIKGAKVIYNVQEIYPDFLINQGSLKSGMVIRGLKVLEKVVYNFSDAVTTIDRVFYNTIVSRFKDASKLFIIPNFVDTNLYRPVIDVDRLDPNLFPHKEAFKVMYAGNIGYAQDWEPLLEMAKRLKDFPVEFWIIGEGVLKARLVNDIKDEGLENIHILPYQPRHNMPHLIAYADIHFIFMNPAMESDGFPSKVYTIMACEKPLLVITGENTPLYNFLEPNNCAILIKSAEKDKLMQLENALKNAIINKSGISTLGKNGFHIIEKQYSKKAVIKQYVSLISGLLNQR
ncbi:MAG TPA: glycosyltransferase family 4 protein [Sphingobacteriaceae bacterium]|nr:glycosyltransferase family 4 protein [Sphingobacteriaceae bacterium]